MNEGFPAAPQTEYPHAIHGQDTTWDHIQEHVDANPGAWNGFAPHLAQNGINTQALLENTEQNAGWDFSKPPSPVAEPSFDSLGPNSFTQESDNAVVDESGKYGEEWDFSKPPYNLTEATAISSNPNSLSQETDITFANETTKQSKFKAFLGKIAFKKTVVSEEEPIFKTINDWYDSEGNYKSTIANPFDYAAQSGLSGNVANGNVDLSDPWASGWDSIPSKSNVASDEHGYDASLGYMSAQSNAKLAPTFQSPAEPDYPRTRAELRTEQYDIERTYDADVVVEPAESTAKLSAAEITMRLEVDHVVKMAPRLSEQLAEGGRDNPVTYVANQYGALHTNTSEAAYKGARETMTEHDALQQLASFLERAESLRDTEHYSYLVNYAESMCKNLAFVGEKEYNEAVNGIADYWKTLLRDNEKQQICIIAGEITKQGYGGQTKSDQYLLDNILSHFTDEEIREFGDRFTFDEDKITADPKDTKVVMLDDWTISGSQLSGVGQSFIARHPELAGQVEVQMIAASAARIKKGTLDSPNSYYGTPSETSMIPIRAYFMAHDADGVGTSSGTHITGSHSSVDYDFENVIDSIAGGLRGQGQDAMMPPMTNIVRPYREKKLLNIERVQKIAKKNKTFA